MIGLTGGIASGKSAVARRLAFLGAVVLDADRLAREAVEHGAPAWAQVKEAFPQVIQEDQTIDRRLLGEIVFSDAQKRKLLESFIHPEVLRMLLARAAQAKAQGRLVVAEVPLLFEVGWEGLMDEVWVVYVRPEVQLERLLARSSLSREQAERMVESQLPLDVKVSRADRVIDNNGPLEKTWEQVDALWEELQREDRFNRP